MNQTICLNMIVKNEANIIEYTLNKLINKIKIDYYVISDTGSIDNTKEIIKNFFNKNNIQGEIFDDIWINFAHNRTIALEHAFKKTDYILIFDADDEIFGNIVLPNKLILDGYKLIFKINMITFQRILLISNNIKWKYESILHEYIINCDEINKIETIKGDYYITTSQISYRNLDKNKYLNDALILENAFEEINDNQYLQARYAFYCANSYFNYENFNKGIEWYKKRIELNGWIQENYVSCLKLFYCYQKINNNEKGIYYLIKSYDFDKERVECIFELIKYYCFNNMFDEAFQYYTLIQYYYENNILHLDLTDKLFINISIYYFYLPFLIIIISLKQNNLDLGLKMYTIIFSMKQQNIEQIWIDRLLYNLKFFINIKSLNLNFIKLFNSYIDFLQNNNYNNIIFLKEQLIFNT